MRTVTGKCNQTFVWFLLCIFNSHKHINMYFTEPEHQRKFGRGRECSLCLSYALSLLHGNRHWEGHATQPKSSFPRLLCSSLWLHLSSHTIRNNMCHCWFINLKEWKASCLNFLFLKTLAAVRHKVVSWKKTDPQCENLQHHAVSMKC